MEQKEINQTVIEILDRLINAVSLIVNSQSEHTYFELAQAVKKMIKLKKGVTDGV